jgi:hypothetical protein
LEQGLAANSLVRQPGGFAARSGINGKPRGQILRRNRGRGKRGSYATFWTLLLRMHDVQTLSRLLAPFTSARTGWRLMFQRRLVTL